MDSSDDDDVIETIRLQKDLISESQLLSDSNAAKILEQKSSALSKPEERGSASADSGKSPTPADDRENLYNCALAANIEYDNMLCKLENNLKDLITDCKSRLSKLSTTRDTGRSYGRNGILTGRNNGLYIFGAPYFKDENFFTCPPNLDVKRKQENGEMVWVTLPPVRWWTPEHTKKLVSAVKQSALAACKQDAKIYKNGLLRRLNTLNASNLTDEANVVSAEIEAFDINKFAQSKLSDKIANSDHDWLKISATVLDGRHTDAECRGFWYNYLHPKFYKGTWTDKEAERLKTLAEETDCQDWDNIALKLGTGRSGYQCFAQYHNALLASAKQKWSDEEDARLKALITKYQIGDYIPWAQVCQQMVGRSQTQVYNRWIYTLDPNIKKGRFSPQEDVIILCGVRMWGEDFQKIGQFMPNRTVPQIRMRYHNYTSNLNVVPFTTEDDMLLVDLVKELGHDWKKVAEHFPGHNRIKVRQRYETVQKFLTQNPGKHLAQLGSRRFTRQNTDLSHQPYWSHAEKLLTGGGGSQHKYCSTSLLTTKTVRKPVRKKKVMSEADAKLLAYFQGSYMAQPAYELTRSFGREDPKCVEQMGLFLELLGAKLAIPSDEELEEDTFFAEEDREMLRGLRSLNRVTELPREPSVSRTSTEPTFSFVDIDCSPQSPSSVSLTLPFNSDPFPREVPLATVKQEPPEDTPLASFRQPFFGSLRYLCPPNHATMVGLRSVLLRKKDLLETISKSSNDPLRIERNHNEPKAFQHARELWDDRLLFLFALPNLLSKIEPPEVPDKQVRERASAVTFLTDEATTTQISPIESAVPPAAKKRKTSDGKEIAVTVPGASCSSGMGATPGRKRKRNNVKQSAVTMVPGVPSGSEVVGPSTATKPGPRSRKRKTYGPAVVTRTVQTRSSKRKHPPAEAVS